MKANLSDSSNLKSGLHPRNKHRANYDFNELIKTMPELEKFVFINSFGTETINFSDNLAVRALNSALLKRYYKVDYWDIPESYLCPPIPGRVDYIHYIADVLMASNGGVIPTGKMVNVLDIGVGANCIYPLLGHQEYGWNFVGSDCDALAVRVANQIVHSNGLSKAIDCRRQVNKQSIFDGIIKPNEVFDVIMCNPPFHTSEQSASAGSERKWKNLGYKKTEKPVLNFGGQLSELWCKGGEIGFISTMIKESTKIQKQSLWFTALVSKSDSLQPLLLLLKKTDAVSVKTITMSQGNKISRILTWTYLNETQHLQWSLDLWKSKGQ